MTGLQFHWETSYTSLPLPLDVGGKKHNSIWQNKDYSDSAYLKPGARPNMRKRGTGAQRLFLVSARVSKWFHFSCSHTTDTLITSRLDLHKIIWIQYNFTGKQPKTFSPVSKTSSIQISSVFQHCNLFMILTISIRLTNSLELNLRITNFQLYLVPY